MSNEGRELTVFRVRKFGLDKVIDFFVCSCFVHLRKPDKDIWRIALDIALRGRREGGLHRRPAAFCRGRAQASASRGSSIRGLEPTKAAPGRLGLLIGLEWKGGLRSIRR